MRPKQWNVEKTIIFETVAGSRLFGTDTPTSDYDRRGVCLPPAEVLLDLFVDFEQQENFETEEKERVIFSLDKFMRLCAKANPNLLELLFAPRSSWLQTSPIWEEIYAQREIFLSKTAQYTFWGYAIAQLKRIERHRSWILNPPSCKPTRSAYGLTDKPTFGAEHMAAILALPTEYIQPELRAEAEKEKSYRLAKRFWDDYDQWQQTRNPARFAMEQKYHYDVKHALHLVRLLGEGEELLLTGQITLPRPDAAELLAIKNGKYTYEELMLLIGTIEKKYQTFKTQSILPKEPDYQRINQLYAKIVREHCFA
jgi:predicted nucleotidyltransferase